MKRSSGWPAAPATLLAAMFTLGVAPGLAGAGEPMPGCGARGGPGRNHIYVYFINGGDPVQLGGLGDVATWVRDELGYPNTYYGECLAAKRFEADIRQTQAADPSARFVVVGYSAGAVGAQRLSERLAWSGIRIDQLVLLDPKWGQRKWPAELGPAPPVLNVVSGGGWPSPMRPDAQNVVLNGVRHLAVPTDPGTLSALSGKLLDLAGCKD